MALPKRRKPKKRKRCEHVDVEVLSSSVRVILDGAPGPKKGSGAPYVRCRGCGKSWFGPIYNRMKRDGRL
jgi:hypothetical protein